MFSARGPVFGPIYGLSSWNYDESLPNDIVDNTTRPENTKVWDKQPSICSKSPHFRVLYFKGPIRNVLFG